MWEKKLQAALRAIIVGTLKGVLPGLPQPGKAFRGVAECNVAWKIMEKLDVVDIALRW